MHIDIETYSTVDIKHGIAQYVSCPHFEILIVAVSLHGEPAKSYYWNELPDTILEVLEDPNTLKFAFNAAFEFACLTRVGVKTQMSSWRCTMVKAAYCGLPLDLDSASKEMLGMQTKMKKGKALIRLFCIPQKPSKANGFTTRIIMRTRPEQAEVFMEYCEADVNAEMALHRSLSDIIIPDFELEYYQTDQIINNRGVEIDLDLVEAAIQLDVESKERAVKEVVALTGVSNPNSVKQLTEWLSSEMTEQVSTLRKADIPVLLDKADSDTTKRVLKLRQELSKSSIKKYIRMAQYCSDEDHRARGLFQFYGANRTGRWAGRGIQMQNLTKHYIKDLDFAISAVKTRNLDFVESMFGSVPSILSQLIRPAFRAKQGHTLVIVDYAAIEARVIAWLAGEQWKLDVFKAGGDIYIEAAKRMFSIEHIDKDTPEGAELRGKGKVAELALGYQGSVGAMVNMGGERMGLSEEEMKAIVELWRESNPRIVALWRVLEGAAIQVIRYAGTSVKPSGYKGISMQCTKDRSFLVIALPSGRNLVYRKPELTENRWGKVSIRYKGMNQTTKQWGWVDTYGGKICENIIQAISRDILAGAIHRVEQAGHEIILHVHDEIGIETPIFTASQVLEEVSAIMTETLPWSEGLPLGVAGFISEYYKKD